MLTDLSIVTLVCAVMQVFMDETQHIWRLLQASEPRRSRPYPDLKELEAELEAAREEKMKARRKRKQETEADAAKKAKKDEAGGMPKRRGKEVTTKRGGGSRKSAANKEEEGDDEEEEQEDCSANPSCLRPTGKEVSAWRVVFSTVLSK